jgi:uncharacterized protein YecE (DUF72 family)
MAQYYIGTSGWHYDHWKGIFYPDGLPKSKWLEFYAMHFLTVELNNSFYRLPSIEAFEKWRTSTPSGFIFTVKVSRYITHIKRLKTADEPMKKFLENTDHLYNKLGPLLYQLPPNMKSDKALLEDFLYILPRQYRHVFEFRHSSWFTDNIFDLLRYYDAGFCVYDMPDFSCPVIATNDTGYIRFHGSRALYCGCYSGSELAVWAKRIEELGKDVSQIYIYFNNDARGYALRNAAEIKKILLKQS